MCYEFNWTQLFGYYLEEWECQAFFVPKKSYTNQENATVLGGRKEIRVPSSKVKQSKWTHTTPAPAGPIALKIDIAVMAIPLAAPRCRWSCVYEISPKTSETYGMDDIMLL